MTTIQARGLALPIQGVRAKTVATLVAIAATVALPQAMHVAGGGPALAQVWLPLFAPVMLVGLLAGPEAGLATGLLGPLVSFGLTGMPAPALLPSLAVQLATFGLVAGLVGRTRWHVLAKTAAILASGNLAAFAFALVVGLVTHGPAAQLWWAALVVGLPGLALQCVVLPLVAAWAARRA